MTERPILFSTPMVQAILEGRKTITRRVMKPQPPSDWDNLHLFCDANYIPTVIDKNGEEQPGEQCFGAYDEEGIAGVKFPFGGIGDVLRVRETWAPALDTITYKADYSEFLLNKPENKGIWKPAIFMPKEACRIKLRITNIRVERLNDISEEDAKREGVTLRGNIIKENNPDFTHKYRFAFCLLWESINGKGSWDQNPWVWVIEFERLEGKVKW